ncbi:MAG: DUF541 domain-containing protein [Phycisphaera sp.]|nr:DUF541 domain-containing protein [Phycisphaera sp.]
MSEKVSSENGMDGGLVARVAAWMGKPGAGLFLLGAALAFGVLGASERLGSALRTMRQDNSIRVKGVAEMDLTSDRGTWQGTVRARASTLPESYAALERSMDALRAFVISAGISNDRITIGSVSMSRNMRRDAQGNATNDVEAYVLTQGLVFTSPDVHVVRQIANDATALIKQGVEVESGDPVFKVSTLEESKMELLEKATANAFERAQTLARGSGNSIGKLASASQGVFHILARGSTSSSEWSGEYDTSTIEKTARVVVTLDYSVE